MGVTPPSTCPWLDHPVSGLIHANSIALFRLAFAAPTPNGLSLLAQINSLTHYTKGTRSPLKGAPTACRHPVSGSISLPSSGCFSPFPHGTGSLSVTEEYLGLEGGPPTFRQDFTCPALLEDPAPFLPVRGYHPLWRAFPDASGSYAQATGLVRVRSPLLAESRLMSFPPATEMFQFAGFASPPYGFRRTDDPKGPGFPIRNPRIKGCSQLPARLFAACYVLHRLSVPRHPPNALQRLIPHSCAKLVIRRDKPDKRSDNRRRRPEREIVRPESPTAASIRPIHNDEEHEQNPEPADRPAESFAPGRSALLEKTRFRFDIPLTKWWRRTESNR